MDGWNNGVRDGGTDVRVNVEQRQRATTTEDNRNRHDDDDSFWLRFLPQTRRVGTDTHLHIPTLFFFFFMCGVGLTRGLRKQANVIKVIRRRRWLPKGQLSDKYPHTLPRGKVVEVSNLRTRDTWERIDERYRRITVVQGSVSGPPNQTTLLGVKISTCRCHVEWTEQRYVPVKAAAGPLDF